MLPRCFELLEEYLRPEISGDVNIKLSYFEKLLTQPEPPKDTVVVVAMRLLNIVFASRRPEYFIDNFGVVVKCIDRQLSSELPSVVEAMQPLLTTIFSTLYMVEQNMSTSGSLSEELRGAFGRFLG